MSFINYRIIAVDFDGTLCEDSYPEIGAPNIKLINYLKNQQMLGDRVILWTCRDGDRLKEALKWCAEKHELIFDAVNENLPGLIAAYGNNSRKIFADEYIDDRMSTRFKLPFESRV